MTLCDDRSIPPQHQKCLLLTARPVKSALGASINASIALVGAAVRGIVASISKATVTNGDRCERLGKNCVSSVSVRKSTSRRARGSRTTQIEHLENKIEDLVTLLRNQTPERSSTHVALDAIGVKTPTTNTHSPYYENVAHDPPAGAVGGNTTLYASGMASVSSTKPIDQVLSVSNVLPVFNFDKPSNLQSHAEPSPLQAEVGLTKSLIFCIVSI